jgi:hypothetical protein
VAIDQGIQAPALLALIIMGMSVMEGEGIEGAKQDMRHEYVSTLIKNCEYYFVTVLGMGFAYDVSHGFILFRCIIL